METSIKPSSVIQILTYAEMKEKMNKDINALFEKLEKINRDKTDLMAPIIEAGNIYSIAENMMRAQEIMTEGDNIVNDFIKEHHEEYDVLLACNYDNESERLVRVIEIEQKHKGVGLHSIIIEYGKTSEDFKITHKIYV